LTPDTVISEPGRTGRRQPNRPLRVCYFGTYRAEYSRNRILIEGLRLNGAEVIECHVPLWKGVEDRVRAASAGWLRPSFWLRVLAAYGRLVDVHRRIPGYDVMVLGYPGQFDVYPARLLSRLRRTPLVLDVFMSTSLIAQERGLVSRHPISGRLLFWLEKQAYRLPDLLIQDTPDYVDWLCGVFGLDADRFRLVPTGADDRIFHPFDSARPLDGTFHVVYHGSFIPNHGVPAILGAAHLLQGQPTISFELIGDGPDREAAERQVKEWRLANVQFTPWLAQEALVERLARADLCLGAFGTTPQSMMTVHNKIYEALAMRLCVVTGDSPAIRRAFEHGKELWLCERLDPGSLAAAILLLEADPALRRSLAESGYQAFRAQYTVAALGVRLCQHLEALMERVRR
jgi:glycosyltransferase involved in cell wall biosynthesis